MTILPKIVDLINFFFDKYDKNISRNEARVRLLKDVYNEYDDHDNFNLNEFKKAWNTHLNIKLPYQCRSIDEITINDNTTLSILLS